MRNTHISNDAKNASTGFRESRGFANKPVNISEARKSKTPNPESHGVVRQRHLPRVFSGDKQLPLFGTTSSGSKSLEKSVPEEATANYPCASKVNEDGASGPFDALNRVLTNGHNQTERHYKKMMEAIGALSHDNERFTNHLKHIIDASDHLSRTSIHDTQEIGDIKDLLADHIEKAESHDSRIADEVAAIKGRLAQFDAALAKLQEDSLTRLGVANAISSVIGEVRANG